MFFAVAHHGTAGMAWSTGYAEIVECDAAPRADQTTTVWGPYEHHEQAQGAVKEMYDEMYGVGDDPVDFPIDAPCGCPECDESVQPGHFACAPSSDWLLAKEKEGEVIRHFDGDVWRWFWAGNGERA